MGTSATEKAICWDLRCWSVSWWFLPRGIWNQHQQHQKVMQLQRVNWWGDLPYRSIQVHTAQFFHLDTVSNLLFYLSLPPSLPPSLLLSLSLFLAAFLPFFIPGCVGPVASFPLFCQRSTLVFVLFFRNHCNIFQRVFNAKCSLGIWWLFAKALPGRWRSRAQLLELPYLLQHLFRPGPWHPLALPEISGGQVQTCALNATFSATWTPTAVVDQNAEALPGPTLKTRRRNWWCKMQCSYILVL